jgi:hypothetical protein
MVNYLVNEGGIIKIAGALIRAMSGEALFKSLGKQLGLDFGSAFNAGEVAKKLSSGLQSVFENAGTALLNLFQEVPTLLLDAGTQLLGGIAEAFSQGVQAILDPITSIPSQIFDGLQRGLQLYIEGWSNMFDGISSAFETLTAPFKNFELPSFSWPKMPSFSWPKMPSFSFPEFEFPSDFEWPEIDFSWPEIPTPGWFRKLTGVGGGGVTGLIDEVSSWFATGGIEPLYAAQGIMVPTLPRGPDTRVALVRPGEMLLNDQQQRNLFRMINEGNPTEITLRLEGGGFMKELIENTLVKSSVTGTGRIRLAVGSES